MGFDLYGPNLSNGTISLPNLSNRKKAVDLALDFISTCDANNKFIIFSDSLSVLKAMNHTSSKNPQIQWSKISL